MLSCEIRTGHTPKEGMEDGARGAGEGPEGYDISSLKGFVKGRIAI